MLSFLAQALYIIVLCSVYMHCYLKFWIFGPIFTKFGTDVMLLAVTLNLTLDWLHLKIKQIYFRCFLIEYFLFSFLM
jgi:hypothetical protein